MALSPPPVEELLRSVHRYYPAGIQRYEREEQYRDSPESRALKDLRRSVVEKRGQAWSGLTRTFVERYGRERVFDWTHLSLDACFTLRMYTPTATPDDAAAVVLMVSVLAPVHATYTVLERRAEGRGLPREVFTRPRPETEALARELDQEASERMQSARIDWEILQIPVPEISTNLRELGRATLADLLFSDDWR